MEIHVAPHISLQDKETKRLYDAKNYKKNREKINLKVKLWREANPERTKEMMKGINDRYYKTPKAFYKALKQSSRKRDMPIKIGKEEFVQWYLSQIKVCYYCGIPEEKLYLLPKMRNRKEVKRLTIDRLDNNKPYEVDNITLACWLCNNVKSDIFTSAEMKSIGRKFIKIRWQK